MCPLAWPLRSAISTLGGLLYEKFRTGQMSCQEWPPISARADPDKFCCRPDANGCFDYCDGGPGPSVTVCAALYPLQYPVVENKEIHERSGTHVIDPFLHFYGYRGIEGLHRN